MRLRRETTHALHYGGRDALGIEHRLVSGHIIGQVILMHAPKRPQKGPQPGSRPLAGVAMDFPLPVAVVVPRPLLLPVLHAAMGQLQFLFHRPVTTPFVGIQGGRSRPHAGGQHLPAGDPIRMLPHEVTDFAARAPDEREDRRAVRRIGAVAPHLISAAARGIEGIGMLGPFFPRRSDTVHPPPPPHRAGAWSARSRTDCPGPAGGSCASAGGTGPTRGRVGPRSHLWRCPAGSAPASPASGGSSRTQCQSGRYRSGRIADSDRPEMPPDVGRAGARQPRSEGNGTPPDGGASPARSGKRRCRADRRWESRSYSLVITPVHSTCT